MSPKTKTQTINQKFLFQEEVLEEDTHSFPSWFWLLTPLTLCQKPFVVNRLQILRKQRKNVKDPTNLCPTQDQIVLCSFDLSWVELAIFFSCFGQKLLVYVSFMANTSTCMCLILSLCKCVCVCFFNFKRLKHCFFSASITIAIVTVIGFVVSKLLFVKTKTTISNEVYHHRCLINVPWLNLIGSHRT